MGGKKFSRNVFTLTFSFFSLSLSAVLLHAFYVRSLTRWRKLERSSISGLNFNSITSPRYFFHVRDKTRRKSRTLVRLLYQGLHFDSANTVSWVSRFGYLSNVYCIKMCTRVNTCRVRPCRLVTQRTINGSVYTRRNTYFRGADLAARLQQGRVLPTRCCVTIEQRFSTVLNAPRPIRMLHVRTWAHNAANFSSQILVLWLRAIT